MKHGPRHGGLKTPMLRRFLPIVLASAVLVACSGGDTTSLATVAPANTVAGVGRLPSIIPEVTFGADIAEGLVLPALEGEPVAAQVNGNRVLMIGDSIFAGLSRRHSNQACDQLVPLGWQVAVEAESGRFAEFGERVARRRSGEGWDAVVVFLGSNYDGARARYEEAMTAIVDRFAQVPVVLVTTSKFRSMQSQVNDTIRSLVAERPELRVIDWEKISTARGLLSRDRIHPSGDGQVVLTAAVAQMLGQAPVGEGACLASLFTDDSVNPEGPRTGNGSSTTSASSSSTSTVAVPDDDTMPDDDTVPDDIVVDDTVVNDNVVDDGVTDDSVPDSTLPDATVPDTTVPDTTSAP